MRENAFENVVCEKAAFSSRPQWAPGLSSQRHNGMIVWPKAHFIMIPHNCQLTFKLCYSENYQLIIYDSFGLIIIVITM